MNKIKTAISEQKKQIRAQIFSARKNISVSEVKTKSKNIFEKITYLSEFQNASNIFTYISFGKEVSTRDLVNHVFKQKKKCLVPKINREKDELEIYEIKNWLDLDIGFKGILEPRKTSRKFINYQKIDLAFLPCVACDKDFYRVGYGKAYFDKLLFKFPEKVLTTILAFDFQVFDQVPREKHDIKAKLLITN